MNAKHKWNPADYFNSKCKKCGCVKTRQIGAFAVYELDGQTYQTAPPCDNRFMPLIPKQSEFCFLPANETIVLHAIIDGESPR